MDYMYCSPLITGSFLCFLRPTVESTQGTERKLTCVHSTSWHDPDRLTWYGYDVCNDVFCEEVTL